jgi:hypothetical protein
VTPPGVCGACAHPVTPTHPHLFSVLSTPSNRYCFAPFVHSFVHSKFSLTSLGHPARFRMQVGIRTLQYAWGHPPTIVSSSFVRHTCMFLISCLHHFTLVQRASVGGVRWCTPYGCIFYCSIFRIRLVNRRSPTDRVYDSYPQLSISLPCLRLLCIFVSLVSFARFAFARSNSFVLRSPSPSFVPALVRRHLRSSWPTANPHPPTRPLLSTRTGIMKSPATLRRRPSSQTVNSVIVEASAIRAAMPAVITREAMARLDTTSPPLTQCRAHSPRTPPPSQSLRDFESLGFKHPPRTFAPRLTGIGPCVSQRAFTKAGSVRHPSPPARSLTLRSPRVKLCFSPGNGRSSSPI